MYKKRRYSPVRETKEDQQRSTATTNQLCKRRLNYNGYPILPEEVPPALVPIIPPEVIQIAPEVPKQDEEEELTYSLCDYCHGFEKFGLVRCCFSDWECTNCHTHDTFDERFTECENCGITLGVSLQACCMATLCSRCHESKHCDDRFTLDEDREAGVDLVYCTPTKAV